MFCQNLGADLAVIKSEEENQFVYDLLRNTSGDYHGWIGLHGKADKYYWLDGRPEEGSFKKWGAGKRISPSKGNCVNLINRIKSKFNGKWNARSCSDITPVAICQLAI